MRSNESSSHTALARRLSARTLSERVLPALLLGALAPGCNAQLDISNETLADGGVGGTGGSGGAVSQPGPPEPNPDAGSPTASCDDGVRSGNETDIDCGGDACSSCAAGASCGRHVDCQSGACLAGVCAATGCEDGIQNGDETGVDCGGSCQRCRSTACNCASTPGLTPLECDETEGYLTPCGERAMLAADGETLVFAMCYLERADATSTSGYELFRRRPDGTIEALGDAGALGLSSDGRLLVYDGGAVSVVNAQGTRTTVPIPEPLSTDARITGDGVTVYGRVTTAAGARTLGRWTESGGLEVLSDLGQLTSATDFEIGAVSHDGSVVVGSINDGTSFAPFRWTEADGLEDLGTLPEGVNGARATAISADGSTIAGFTVRGVIEAHVFRWTAQSALQLMGGALPLASWPDASTLLLGSDGTALAAAVLNGAPMVAHFGASGTQVPNTGLAFVTDMTADGTVLVGNEANVGFLWRPPLLDPQTAPPSAYDVTRIEALLAETAADTSGWALQTITNISDDGRIIYGTGTCGGTPTYYRAQLRP